MCPSVAPFLCQDVQSDPSVSDGPKIHEGGPNGHLEGNQCWWACRRAVAVRLSSLLASEAAASCQATVVTMARARPALPTARNHRAMGSLHLEKTLNPPVPTEHVPQCHISTAPERLQVTPPPPQAAVPLHHSPFPEIQPDPPWCNLRPSPLILSLLPGSRGRPPPSPPPPVREMQ